MPDCTQVYELVRLSKLAGMLSSTGSTSLTFFAPEDTAFADVDAATMELMMSDQTTLDAVRALLTPLLLPADALLLDVLVWLATALRKRAPALLRHMDAHTSDRAW